MLMEGLTHREILLQRRQRHTAKVAPGTQHPVKIDIDDYVS
jgi:hypothetical protein